MDSTQTKKGGNTGMPLQKDAPEVDILDDAWVDDRAECIKRFFTFYPELKDKVDPFFAPKDKDPEMMRQHGYMPAYAKEGDNKVQINDRGDLMWIIEKKLHRRRLAAPGRLAAEQCRDAFLGQSGKFGVRDADGKVLRPEPA